jgi:hypothetical protein
MADIRTRLIERIKSLQDSGMSDDDIERNGAQITADLLGPGPWEATGDYIMPGDASPRPFSQMPTGQEELPRESLLSRAPGAIADAGRFMAGAGNAFAARAADSATLGYLAPEKALEMAGQNFMRAQAYAKAGMGSPASLRQATRDLESAKQAARDAEAHKIAGGAGTVAGGLFGPGATAATRISQGGAGLGRAVVSGATGGAIDAGGRALVEGKGAGEIVDEGGIGALLGGTLGGSLHAVGEGLRNPLGETGATIQALQRGRKFLESPENAALPKGIRGIGAQAYDTGEQLGALQANKLAASRAQISAAEEALPVQMDEPISVAGVHRQLNRSVDRLSNDMAVRPDVEKATGNIKDRLSRVTRQRIIPIEGPDARRMPGAQKTVGFEQGEEVRTPQATPRDLVKERREVRRQAEFGAPQTPENAPYRELYKTLQEATHSDSLPGGIGKALKATDAQFSSDMQKLAEGNELIFGKDSARAVTEGVNAAKTGASKLGQALMDTRAGGAQLRVLEKIRALGPEYAEAVDRVAAKIAEQGSTFGLPKTLSHPGKWATQIPMQNLRALNVNAVEPLTRSPRVPAAVGGAAAPLLRDPLDAVLKREKKK